MNIFPVLPNFTMPSRSTELAGGYDIYMPSSGAIYYNANEGFMVGLGFAAEVPEGHVALLLPRSGVGAKKGLSLNNTCGVIDADYRGEWMASLRLRDPGNAFFEWEEGDRILQFLIVPVATPELKQVSELAPVTDRTGGYGSTGK